MCAMATPRTGVAGCEGAVVVVSAAAVGNEEEHEQLPRR